MLKLYIQLQMEDKYILKDTTVTRRHKMVTLIDISFHYTTNQQKCETKHLICLFSTKGVELSIKS